MANSSVTITFTTATSSDDQTLVIEMDDEKNEEVYGEERSEFLYGEKAYFRVYKYPPDLVITVNASDGTITQEGTGTSEEEETVSFAKSNSGSLDKPAASVSSTSWMGNSLGAVSVVGNDVSVSNEGVGVLNFAYTADFERFGISVGVKDVDEYPVVVCVSSDEE